MKLTRGRAGKYGFSGIFEPLLNTLHGDYYLLHADFDAYIKKMDIIDVDFKNTKLWAEKSVTAALSMGKFSSDRSIQEYAAKIWHVKPATVK